MKKNTDQNYLIEIIIQNYIIEIIILISTVISVFYYKSMFTEWNISVLASILQFITLSIVKILINIKQIPSSLDTSLKESARTILELTSIPFDFYQDKNLFQILKLLAEMRNLANIENYSLEEFDKKLYKEIRDMKLKIEDEYIESFEAEQYRIIDLAKNIKNSKKYVYALTYDENNYLRTFWSDIVIDNYVSVNTTASDVNKVSIIRIFLQKDNIIKDIIDPNFKQNQLSTDEKERKQKLIDVTINLLRECKNCEVYWLSEDYLDTNLLNKTNTSFLVCDEIYASESQVLCGKGSHFGFELNISNSLGYKTTRSDIIKKLTERFKILKVHSNKVTINESGNLLVRIGQEQIPI